jgi:hypothetical protein
MHHIRRRSLHSWVPVLSIVIDGRVQEFAGVNHGSVVIRHQDSSLFSNFFNIEQVQRSSYCHSFPTTSRCHHKIYKSVKISYKTQRVKVLVQRIKTAREISFEEEPRKWTSEKFSGKFLELRPIRFNF